MKVLSVVGARPQFVKLAPVAHALEAAGHEHVIVHTGQHYDDRMSGVFFDDLKIPEPDVNLGVGSGSHAAQTATALAGLEPVLDRYRPDWVLVYGDTNSTLAGALAAVKLHLPLAHVEAGLRSGNRRMPEEHNRVLTDHAADVLLAPTGTAVAHLEREGLADRTFLVGDVTAGELLRVAAAVAADPGPTPWPDGEYMVATVHRPENTDDPERLVAVIAALAALPVPVFLAAHPRLVDAAERHGLDLDFARDSVRVVDALPYPQMVRALLGCRGVVTDSGGLQKDAYLLGRPATTLRSETEWPETLAGGWNVLCTDLTLLPALAIRPAPTTPPCNPFGGYRAAERVVEVLER